MWPCKKQIKENDYKIEFFDIDKEQKEKEQKQLNLVYDDIDSSTHVFDWAAVNAFSIERNAKYEQGELIAYTIIGFLRTDGETGEWSYICSQEEHNRLAADFTLYVAMKNQPKPVKAPPKEVAPSKVTRK